MRDLLKTPFVEPVASLLRDHIERLQQADMIHISAPATLEGVLALGQLEAAFLDNGWRYSRRFSPARKHVPRDENLLPAPPESGLGVYLNVEEETWELGDVEPSAVVNIMPLKTHVNMGGQQRLHAGALDPVLQAATIAAALAPNGRRVRSLRPYITLGLWMRGALDTSYDPIHSSAIAHLQDEGSVRTVPLPEVESPAPNMIPGLAERQLKRLSKAWPNMDVDERTLALSELVLPCLTHSQLSTPRLEELVWHRMVLGGQPQDLVSQAHIVQSTWPDEQESCRIHASKVLDRWLTSGTLASGA